jgi:hypothetical protein
MKLYINKELQKVLNRAKEDKHLAPLIEQLETLEVDPESKDYINYLGIAVDDDTKMSYLNKGKIEKLSEWEMILNKHWDKDYRIMGKPSKILKTLLPNTPDTLLTKFASQYKMSASVCGECLDTSIVHILKGKDIKTYYHYENYEEEGREDDNNNSALWESCMRDEDCQTYFDIYTKNTEQVSMAVMFSENNLIKCRCILWHNQGITYYDRIYATNNEVNRHMQSCLEKMGFINISPKNIIDGHPGNIQIQLAFGDGDIAEWPYMDTMHYLEGNTLTNYYRKGAKDLQCTDGSYVIGDCCDRCGEESDELHYIGTGDHHGEHQCGDCCTYSDFYCEYVADADGQDTDHDGFILDSHVRTLWDGKTCHEENAVKLWDGEYAYGEEVLESVCGKLFADQDDFVEIDGDWYYKESEDIEYVDGEYKLKEEEYA